MGAIQRARKALMQWIGAEYNLRVFEPDKNSARISLKAMLAAVLRVRPPAKITNNTIQLILQGNSSFVLAGTSVTQCHLVLPVPRRRT